MRKKNRKTFYNWLTNRYQLIIRNEENFAEKTTIGFNYARVIALGFIFFVLIFVASLYFGKHFLSSWYEPDYIVNEQRKELSKLSAKIDQFEKIVAEKDHRLKQIKVMLIGGDTIKQIIDTTKNSENYDFSKLNLDSISYLDQNIRAEYEQAEITPEIDELDVDDFQFIPPIAKPKITKNFNKEKAEFKLNLKGSLDAEVVSILDGQVFSSGENEVNGKFVVIQHSSYVFSKVTQLKSILIKDGSLLKAGEKIGVAGDSDEGKSMVVFELIVNGNPVDPLPYIKL